MTGFKIFYDINEYQINNMTGSNSEQFSFGGMCHLCFAFLENLQFKIKVSYDKLKNK
jgi:hypothetical protein